MFVSNIASAANIVDNFFIETSYLCFIVFISIIVPKTTNDTDTSIAINVPSMTITDEFAILSAISETKRRDSVA